MILQRVRKRQVNRWPWRGSKYHFFFSALIRRKKYEVMNSSRESYILLSYYTDFPQDYRVIFYFVLWPTNANYFTNYNDISNKHDATPFPFINIFKSALHVSGDKFVNHQEHVLTVYTAFGTTHRHCCRPVHCNKSCMYSQKVLLRLGEFVARNM